ncbi:MAG: hypothetical protein D6705_17555 [Deltaproteobacteria bacterium]|nr:MAG: hypothetical protein D6705_17555 [Deltaproteobacteria bacterium]
MALATVAWAACTTNAPTDDRPPPTRPPDEAPAPRARTASPPPPAVDPGPVTKGSMREHPLGWALRIAPGKAPERLDIAQAEVEGLTVVDLSDDWVPFIFSEKTPGRDDATPNAYRTTYVGLANDRIDENGSKLPEGAHNFLELYGIPPTLSVVHAEWEHIDRVVVPCLEERGYDPAVFEEAVGTIAYVRGKERRYVGPAAWARKRLEKAMRRAGLDPEDPAAWQEAANHPKTRRLHKAWRRHQAPLDVVRNAQIRLLCEGLYERPDRVELGRFDHATHLALAAFEKKHDIMGWGHITPDNRAVFALSPAEANYARLLRVLEERAVSAAGVLEDGSAAAWKPKFRWTDEDGKEHPLRNMAAEVRDALVEALGITDPASARRVIGDLLERAERDEDGLAHLLVAVPMPELPSYYGDDMEFSVVIDRGDVWYDLPFDAEGNPVAQPRRRYPHLTLYVHHLDQKIPLVHWRTTIGSWRSEIKDGKVYYKYKNSDVGPRVWKDIYAAPAWIPPDTTPPDELLARRYVDGKLRTVVNYAEMGPGFRSAYGLVAAYHIRQVFDREGNLLRELDNQIRTHGSVDYMSILRRYSHGCHRLLNQNAVRLFSFILRHREFVREGQQPVGYRRAFEHEGETYRIAIDTRGYRYHLQDPIPVLVTKGRIRGKRKAPITEYVRKPGVEYDDVSTDEESLETPMTPLPGTSGPEPQPPPVTSWPG